MWLLIFDIDGTIFNNNELSTISYSKAVNSLFGINQYTKDWDTYLNTSDIGILREICAEYKNMEITWSDVLEFEDLYYRYFKEGAIKCAEAFQTTKGFVEAYEKLKEDREIKTAIYTGGMRKIALEKLNRIGICERKCAIAAAQDGLTREEIMKATIYKSHAMYAIEKFDRMIIVGDSRRDIQVAKKNNLPIIMVVNTMNTSDIKKYDVKYTIEDFTNFVNVVKEIVKKG